MNHLISFALILLSSINCTVDAYSPSEPVAPIPTTIQWMSLEEAMVANEAEPKRIFIDVYTDWCKWCTVMDKKTFTDPTVIAYMNENFHSVKLNAEQNAQIIFNGKTYEYEARGNRGINTLALELLDGRASYPAFVILEENLERLGYFRGYSEPEKFLGKVEKTLAVVSN